MEANRREWKGGEEEGGGKGSRCGSGERSGCGIFI